jgi:hypothetical protein
MFFVCSYIKEQTTNIGRCAVQHPDFEPTHRKPRKRIATEFLTLVLFFGTLYTGALVAHGYGL